MSTAVPELEPQPEASLRLNGSMQRAVPRDRIHVPSDLLARAKLSVLKSELTIKPILHPGYHRLNRKKLSSRSVALPDFEPVAPGVVRVVLRAPPDPGTHLELSLDALPGEHFVGFGERFNAVDQRGNLLESWVDEGAVGFGEALSPLLTRLGVSWNPFPKGPTIAYKPIPWFISSRGYGLLFQSYAPIFFDIAKSDAKRVVCEIAAHELELLLFYDAAPAELIERMTARTGRPPGLPDWALAPWNDAIGGEAAVRRVAKLLRREKIPSSVIWTEDWQGAKWQFNRASRFSWYAIFPVMRTVSRDLYPAIETLADELHAGGYKFLSYYYPYVTTVDPDFESADENGYLLRDASGDSIVFPLVTDRAGQIDLTHPEARAWYGKELERGLSLGFDGWMADFGEYTPVGSVPHDGASGIEHHNRFPALWSELNLEVLRRARPDGDFVFFSRSGTLGQQATTPVFWSGDSNTDFERWDGLPSNLRGLLSAGLSGLSIWAADVGGYMSLWTRGRDAETLARWAEVSALMTVMRTHHGTHPLRSVQFDSTPETLAHYRAYARLHTALFPQRRRLVDEAKQRGLPVCRPLLLHYPDDAASWTIEDQFLLGPELLVAPILERGARSRIVYLPPGPGWVDLWRGKLHPGGRLIQVEAPLGVIPLFLRADAALGSFDTEVDTLVRRSQVKNEDVATLDDAEKSLAVTVGPKFEGPVTLYDGTALSWDCDHQNDLLPIHSTPGLHALFPPTLVRAWRRLGSGFGRSGVIDCGGRYLRVVSPIERAITLYEVG